MKLPFVHKSINRAYLPYLDFAAVLLATGIFTAAALPNMLHASAYFDEGYGAYISQFDPLTTAFYTANDVHPPLYYWMLHVWQSIVGNGVAQLRFMSIIFAWVAIVFAFLLVRKWFGRKAAWLAVFLFALSPLFVRYGGVMRMYTLSLSIALAGTYVLLKAIPSKGKKWWLAYAALVAAGMYTNYFMALVWASHVIWLVYEYRKNHDVMRAWRLSFMWSILMYLPWLPLLLFRYGEIQINGFWIKPPTLDSFTSTISMSVLFRSASETTTWLAIGLIALIIGLFIAGKQAYQHMHDDQKPVFRLFLALATLPVILLAAASLPPLRPSYVYRYVLVASVFSALCAAIVIVHAKFDRHNFYRRSILGMLTIVLLIFGTTHVFKAGDRNLDMGKQNKLSQVMARVHASGQKAPIVLRSPYTYYIAQMYDAKDYTVRFVYTDSLSEIGSTRPLANNPEDGVRNFKGMDSVWLVGEDLGSVSKPSDGNWVEKLHYYGYDDITDKLVAAAAYYERVK